MRWVKCIDGRPTDLGSHCLLRCLCLTIELQAAYSTMDLSAAPVRSRTFIEIIPPLYHHYKHKISHRWYKIVHGCPPVVTGLHCPVSNVSGKKCQSDCRSRGCEFDLGQVPYFRGDLLWNNFYSHSPIFHWIIQEGLFSVTCESMCMKYWLTACSSLPRKNCG